MDETFIVGLIIIVFGGSLVYYVRKELAPLGTAKEQRMMCPHCQTFGFIKTRKVDRKKGISGGKAVAALMTGGVSMLATGLSRTEEETEAHCSKCNSTWHY